MWVYESPIGLMEIKFNSSSGKYLLIINGTCYEKHNSAISAADNVYMHCTGCYEWDCLDGQVDVPHDIYEWEKQT